MEEILVKLVVDLSKPKGQRESIIPLTEAEIEEREAENLVIQALVAEQKAAEEQTAIDAQAGRDALVALGLTEAQITALVGA